jgi:hypothetical protein
LTPQSPKGKSPPIPLGEKPPNPPKGGLKNGKPPFRGAGGAIKRGGQKEWGRVEFMRIGESNLIKNKRNYFNKTA